MKLLVIEDSERPRRSLSVGLERLGHEISATGDGRGEVRQRIEGLEAGADDDLVEPFDHDEVCARIAAPGRRFSEDGEVSVPRRPPGELPRRAGAAR